MKKTISLTFSFIFISVILMGQVVVNEYSASNLESLLDNNFRTEDWIELYNNSDSPVNISGWYLSDKSDKPEKWQLPENTSIDGKGYLIFFCSGRDGFVNGEYHTNFKLAQSTGKDRIVFSNASGEVIDDLEMVITLTEHSNSRATDGSEDWTITTIATPGLTNDNVTKYKRYTVAPSIDLEAGFYTGDQIVTISNNEPNSVLRYTTDGHNPTVFSPEYTGSLTITETTVVKAQSYSNDQEVLTGKMDFNTYFIDEEYSLAVFSVAANDVIDLANGQGELIPIGSLEYFNVDKEREATSFGSLNRHGQDSWVLDHRSIDWVSRDEMGYSKAVEAPLFSFSDRDEYQKFMFRNSGDDNYPATQGGAPADDNHQGSTHIRDEYVQTLAQEGGMELDVRAVERVVLFLNGEYWGVYGMRDRPVDHDYTNEYYDQGKFDIQYLTTWGSTEIQYGGQKALDDWRSLRDFILLNDMSIEDNYKIAEDSINMTSLIDYMIANLTSVASDWLNYNTGWWRGLNPDGKHKKWGYILWDLDATFDYYINYSGVPNIAPDATACDLETISDFMDGWFGNEIAIDTSGGGGMNPDSVVCETILNGSCPYEPTDSVYLLTIAQDEFCCNNDWDGICQSIYDNFAAGNGSGGGGGNSEFLDGDIGRHESIFLKLLDENETFRQLYYSRYADLLNTVYSCENMNETLERMLGVIRPEMPRQIDRWGGTMEGWNANVQKLSNFINIRCQSVDDGMIECYDELSGPYQVTLMTQPDGIGEIDFNTLDIEEFPWSGEYFGGMENIIKAKVFNEFEDEYKFSHWETRSGSVISPDVNSRKATMNITSADTLIAIFDINTSVENLGPEYDFNVYPNPANDRLIFEYNLVEAADVQLSLSNIIGEQVTVFKNASGQKSAGNIQEMLDLKALNINSGLYILTINIDKSQRSFKINIIK